MPQSKSLRLTLAQLNPTVGDIDGNAQQMLDIWHANDETTDIVLFPELFLCGYPPEDLVLNYAFMTTISKKVEEICKITKSYKSAALIPTAWGCEPAVHNAALLIEGGKIRYVFKKHMLPNYYVFDEPRTFWPAEIPEPYEFRGHKLGIMICEDIWHVEVPAHLKDKGAEILIAINGSPYHDEQEQKRKEIALACIEETGLSLIYLNMFGGQDELLFDGNSFIMHRGKNIIYKSPAFEEDIINITISNDTDTPKHQIFDIKGNKNTVIGGNNLQEERVKAITTGIRDYVHKNGFKDVIIGLSGGIDSALTAALAVKALGENHVRCIMLPSEFTSADSLQDAEKCAEELGISYEILPIKDAVKTFEKIIPDLKGLAHENTQSRIRGTILMAMSNITGALLLTTGNKSEMAVGYCTLYGDMNGAYNPLKDLYKTELYDLARHMEIKPERIITKAPTAELRENQTDQDSLPPYDVLDQILRALIEFDNHNHAEMNYTFTDEDVARVAKMLRQSEYKRFQACPGPRLSARAFGRDRRYPMTNHFTNKIEKST